MTIDTEAGTIWIVGMLAAIPVLRQAWLFFKDVKGPQRTPPLPEEIAKCYVTKPEFEKCRDECRANNQCIREEIKENDRMAENRAKGTHNRIDEVFTEQKKTNKQLGILIGINLARDRNIQHLLEESES